MEAKNLMVAVTLLLLVLPLSASGEATIPYIDIKYPTDGQTVGETTNLVVVAEGNDLRNPYVTIKGNQGIGVSFPLKGCVYTSPVETTTPNQTNSKSPVPPYTKHMYCSTDISLSSFQNQKVELSVSISESGRTLSDSVGLYVSGQCA